MVVGHIKHSLALQMKLLNCGLITEALEIEAKTAEIISVYESLEKVPENITLPTSEYEQIAQKAFGTEFFLFVRGIVCIFYLL